MPHVFQRNIRYKLAASSSHALWTNTQEIKLKTGAITENDERPVTHNSAEYESMETKSLLGTSKLMQIKSNPQNLWQSNNF